MLRGDDDDDHSQRGRKSHSWYHKLDFLKIRTKTGRLGAKCKFCNSILQNSAIKRLEAHRRSCKFKHDEMNHLPSSDDNNQNENSEILAEIIVENNPQPIPESSKTFTILNEEKLSEIFSEHQNGPSSSKGAEKTKSTEGIITPSSSRTSTPSSLQEPPAKRQKPLKDPTTKKTNSKISSFIDSMTHKGKHHIDLAIGKLFFGCNIPFSVIESDYFIECLKIIRPSYTPPTRKTLSTTILDQIHSDITEYDSEKLPPETTLLVDGWKNSNNNSKNVVTMLQGSDGRSAFLKSFDFTDNKETGEELAKICEEAVQLAKTKYNTDVYAIVSDNAANMVKMGRLVDLWHCTCNSHTGNLLIKDISDKNILEKVTVILKQFKHSDLEKTLVDNEGYRVVLPVETRWCSYRNACNSLLKNLHIMKRIAAEEKFSIRQEVKQLLFNDSFITSVKDLVALLDPVCELINNCQKSNYTVADAAEEWLKLEFPEGLTTEKNRMSALVRSRKAVNLYGLTANYLHPLYRGKRLSQSQSALVEDFLIEQLNADGLDGLLAYQKGEGVFKILFEKGVTNPRTFWGLSVERKYPFLAKLALKLINIPASSAQLERVFSQWSFVHNQLRNRLTQEKSEKLIHIYYSLKLKDSNSTNEY